MHRILRRTLLASAFLFTGLAQAAASDSPYGVATLWAQSDWVAKAVLALLVLFSAASWYVIVTKALQQLRLGRQARAAARDFWGESSVQAGAAKLAEHSAYRELAEAGLQAVQRHAGLRGRVPLNEWLDQQLYRATERLQRQLNQGLSLLATVGSTSPFVGLFGTVWGIYHALSAIGVAGQASIDKVAGPVGEALIMTAIGLAVAVPAVLGYNWLLRRNAAALEELSDFSAELQAVLLGAAHEAPAQQGIPTAKLVIA